MRRAALGIFLLVPAFAIAATGNYQQPEWSVCAQDSDCVAIQGICNPAAVRKGYEEIAGTYFKKAAQKAKCQQQFWQPSLDRADAKCWQEHCQIVGKEKAQ